MLRNLIKLGLKIPPSAPSSPDVNSIRISVVVYSDTMFTLMGFNSEVNELVRGSSSTSDINAYNIPMNRVSTSGGT